MNADLRGLVAELREGRKDFDGNMMEDWAEPMGVDCGLLRRAEEALSVAQGQGFVMMPREPTTEILIALAEASLGILTESVTLVEGYSNILAAPAQPDGVSK